MFIQVADFFNLSAHQVMERAALQQGVTEIGNACRCKADTRVIKVVEVAFQVLVREVARYVGEVVHHPLPLARGQSPD